MREWLAAVMQGSPITDNVKNETDIVVDVGTA